MGRALEPHRRNVGLTGRPTVRRSASRPPRASGPIAPRTAAFHILTDVEEGAFADRAADARLGGLSPDDRRLAMELAFGCIRLRARLDTELEAFVDRPIERLELPVLAWLRLGLYQLRELRVPNHAAVNESVEGVRKTVGGRATGLVNAVLRAAAADPPTARAERFPALQTDPVGFLSTYGSHPEWLIRRWIERWSVDEVLGLASLDNRAPPVTLRPLDDRAASQAAEEPSLRRLPDWPNSWELSDGDPRDLLGRIRAIVQDPAASAVVDYVGADLTSPFLDMCSAPGGKAIALAATERPLTCFAADRSLQRLRRVVEGAARVGVQLSALTADGRQPPLRSAGSVLIDAPCLGTGVLRRRPDARWRVGMDRLAELVTLQRALLDSAAELVAPEGLLVYATCSLEPEENEEQVAEFLARHPDFVPDTPEGTGLPADVLGERGELYVLPWLHDTDGSFAVRLRKTA